MDDKKFYDVTDDVLSVIVLGKETALNEKEKERYQREILIIGEENQKQLKTKTVLQVGAGGLGSPLAMYLVSSGIGHLIIFEPDTVSLSNLGRQILYASQDISHSKGSIAKERLQALNPNVKITIVEKLFQENTARRYLEEEKVDYLVDASDNFEAKFLINDLGLEFNIPFTIAGIHGFEGQLISVTPHQTACYRCIFGDIPTTKESGPIPVMSPTCGVVGSLEAMEVIKGLIGIGKRIENALLMISLDAGDFSKIPLKVNPRCPCQLRE